MVVVVLMVGPGDVVCVLSHELICRISRSIRKSVEPSKYYLFPRGSVLSFWRLRAWET